MKVIIGLGNPESQYELTKHNMGYRLIDSFLNIMEVPNFWFEENNMLINQVFCYQQTANELLKEPVVLIKPTTGMNQCGDIISHIQKFITDVTNDLIVVYDNMDLKPGVIKYKSKGSAHGHHGLESIINALGTDKFIHISFGIGKPDDFSKALEYVLSPFNDEDEVKIRLVLEQVAKKIPLIVFNGIEHINDKDFYKD